MKNLLGIIPQGVVSFVSEPYGGRVSDKHLTEHWHTGQVAAWECRFSWGTGKTSYSGFYQREIPAVSNEL